MKLDTATALVTAFPTFQALYLRAMHGYVPSLTAGKSDDLPTRRAKTILISALQARGCPVFDGNDGALKLTAAIVRGVATRRNLTIGEAIEVQELNLTSEERARMVSMLTPNMDNDRPG